MSKTNDSHRSPFEYQAANEQQTQPPEQPSPESARKWREKNGVQLALKATWVDQPMFQVNGSHIWSLDVLLQAFASHQLQQAQQRIAELEAVRRILEMQKVQWEDSCKQYCQNAEQAEAELAEWRVGNRSTIPTGIQRRNARIAELEKEAEDAEFDYDAAILGYNKEKARAKQAEAERDSLKLKIACLEEELRARTNPPFAKEQP